jgi:F-type H+-transporting ATPase subunit alpha
MSTLDRDLDRLLPDARARALRFAPVPRLDQVGVVRQVGDGVAVISGLPDTRLDELLVFADERWGIAVALERDHVGCVLLGPGAGIAAGSEVSPTGDVVRTPVGEALLGRVVDALGTPLDDGAEIRADRLDPVERPAPPIVDRDPVSRPLQTGLLVVDTMVPIGRGQRELIIGDRKTGKSAIAVDTILNQKNSDVVCVYAAIGQKASSVAAVIDAVRRHGAPERCIFVVSSADSPPGLQWITPYAACSMAEYFRDNGRDALLVIDDLTKHAAVYREISLLLRAPPGREAFPGDIFYIHARLLERAAKLAQERGGGSLTALPIAETQAGNLSAYIPTNLVSITDGQIYLDEKQFHEGHKPAVDVGKSVSRVGGKSQTTAMKPYAETLRLDYAQFVELELFARFSGALDMRTRRTIDRGRRIRALLAQPQFAPFGLGEQVALLLSLKDGIVDSVALERIAAFRNDCRAALAERAGAVLSRIDTTGELSDEDRESLLAVLRDAAVRHAATASPPRSVGD